MYRYISLAIAAVSRGLAYGHHKLSGEVKKQKQQSIAEAAIRAREEIRKSAKLYLRQSMIDFYIRFGLKMIVLLALFSLMRTGWISELQYAWLILTSIGLFILWDSVIFIPQIQYIAHKIRQYGWNPRKTFGEVVAAHVFDRIYAETQENLAQMKTHQKLMIRLAGNDQDTLTKEIAAEVTAISKQTSWSDIRPYLIMAGSFVLTLSGLYTGFIWSIV